jgi:hypothetical protein
MGNIKLDKNYNFIEDKSVYNDDFVEAVDLISKAQSDKVITVTEANLLFRIILKKEFNKEAKTITPFTTQTPEVHSFFMNMKSKQIKHV